jgi:hypothetical protein
MLGETSLVRIPDEHLSQSPWPECNSAAVIVKHLSGNMISRWTDFLTTDGEKPDRNRDAEFNNDLNSRADIVAAWHRGWEVFLQTLDSLGPEDLTRIIYIRNQGHTVAEAINRQLEHYPYHIGQLVMLAKLYAPEWLSLSIPKKGSVAFNAFKLAQPKQKGHFTDEFLNTRPKSD